MVTECTVALCFTLGTKKSPNLCLSKRMVLSNEVCLRAVPAALFCELKSALWYLISLSAESWVRYLLFEGPNHLET